MTRGAAGRHRIAEQVAERYERIAELTRQGLSARQIAEKLGTTRRTVERGRKATNTSVGPAPQEFWLTPGQITRAEQLIADGASLEEVARTIGCHPTSVYKRWGEHAWSRRQVAEHASLVRDMRRRGLI